MSQAHVPLSPAALEEAERQALIAAVAEARADPRPDIPHEEVRAEILAEIETLERQLAVEGATHADRSTGSGFPLLLLQPRK